MSAKMKELSKKMLNPDGSPNAAVFNDFFEEFLHWLKLGLSESNSLSKSNVIKYISFSFQRLAADPKETLNFIPTIFKIFIILIQPQTDQDIRMAIWQPSIELIDSVSDYVAFSSWKPFMKSAFSPINKKPRFNSGTKSIFSFEESAHQLDVYLSFITDLVGKTSATNNNFQHIKKRVLYHWQIISDIILQKFFKTRLYLIKKVQRDLAFNCLQVVYKCQKVFKIQFFDSNIGSPKMVKYLIEIIRYVGETASKNLDPQHHLLAYKFCRITFPCNILTTDQNSVIHECSDIRQIIDKIGSIVGTKSGSFGGPLLFGYFSAIPSDEVVTLIDDMTRNCRECSAFLTNLIIFMIDMTHPFLCRIKSNSAGNYYNPNNNSLIAHLFSHVLRLRCLIQVILKSKIDQKESLLPTDMIFDNKPLTMHPFLITISFTILFDKHSISYNKEENGTSSIINFITNNSLSYAPQLFARVASQIAVTLSPLLLNIPEESAQDIRSNSIFFERRQIENESLVKIGKVATDDVFFYFPMNTNDYTKQLACQFLISLIKSIDQDCKSVFSISVAGALLAVMNWLPPTIQIDYTFLFSQLLPHLIKVLFSKSAHKFDNVLYFSVTYKLIKIANGKNYFNSSLAHDWCRVLIRLLKSGVKPMDEVIIATIECILNNFPLSFSLIPLLTRVFPKVEINDFSVEDQLKILSYLGSISMIATDIENAHPIIETNLSVDIRHDTFQLLLFFFDKCPNISDDIDSLTFTLFLNDLRSPRPTIYGCVKSLVMLRLAHFVENPSYLFCHLLWLLPPHIDLIFKKCGNIFNSFIEGPFNIILRPECSPIIYDLLTQFLVDVMLFIRSGPIFNKSLAFITIESDNERIQQILESKTEFLLANYRKPNGIVEFQNNYSYYSISKVGSTFCVRNDGDSIVIDSSQPLGSARYRVASSDYLTINNHKKPKGAKPAIARSYMFSQVPQSALLFKVLQHFTKSEIKFSLENKDDNLAEQVVSSFYLRNQRSIKKIGIIYLQETNVYSSFTKNVFSVKWENTSKQFRLFTSSLGSFSKYGDQICVHFSDLHNDVTFQVSPLIQKNHWGALRTNKVLIIWNENNSPINIQQFSSKSIRIYIVVTPIRGGLFRVSVIKQLEVLVCPISGTMLLPKEAASELVRLTAIQADNEVSRVIEKDIISFEQDVNEYWDYFPSSFEF